VWSAEVRHPHLHTHLSDGRVFGRVGCGRPAQDTLRVAVGGVAFLLRHEGPRLVLSLGGKILIALGGSVGRIRGGVLLAGASERRRRRPWRRPWCSPWHSLGHWPRPDCGLDAHRATAAAIRTSWRDLRGWICRLLGALHGRVRRSGDRRRMAGQGSLRLPWLL
jgi:hypothetical protein